ncbi:MAG: FadR family transcriptional regulator [Actinobacteria bacterium]|nr:FadR family transcriptional regulator [Actinomycetota bacterium]
MRATGQFIGRASVVQQASDRLVQMIDLGEFQPGHRLPSAEALAAVLDVSRPVVLQALQLLEVRGRVLVRHGSGTWVAPATPGHVGARLAEVWKNRSEILQKLVIRELLEVGVARRLGARGLSPERVAKAMDLMDAMEAASDKAVLRRLDSEFHSTLEAGCELPLLEAILLDARAAVAATFEFLPWPSQRVGASNVEHRRFLKAIVSADPEAAEEAIRDHMSLATTLVERLLVGDGHALLETIPGAGVIGAASATSLNGGDWNVKD